MRLAFSYSVALTEDSIEAFLLIATPFLAMITICCIVSKFLFLYLSFLQWRIVYIVSISRHSLLLLILMAN